MCVARCIWKSGGMWQILIYVLVRFSFLFSYFSIKSVSAKFRVTPSELFTVALPMCCSWWFSMKEASFRLSFFTEDSHSNFTLIQKTVVLVAVSLSLCLCARLGSYIHLPLCGCVWVLIPSSVSEEARKAAWISQIQNLNQVQTEGYGPHLSFEELHVDLRTMLMSRASLWISGELEWITPSTASLQLVQNQIIS